MPPKYVREINARYGKAELQEAIAAAKAGDRSLGSIASIIFRQRVLHSIIKFKGNGIHNAHLFKGVHVERVEPRKLFSSYRKSEEDSSIKTLRRHKKLFAISLFSCTLLLTWFLNKKKLNKLRIKLDGCVRIPIDEALFQSNTSLYRLQGFVFPGQIVMSGVFQELPNFQFREEDIIVASFPKTGTTWIQEIVYMLAHNFEKSEDSSEILETRFPYLEYPYPGIKSITKISGRRFIKTHLPSTLLPDNFMSSGAKLIYIMRNPRDTAVSYYHFMKLLATVNFIGSFKDFVHLFTSDKVPYGPFYDHIQSYRDIENEENVLVVYYENLKENPVNIIKRVAEFLEIPISDEDALKVAAATSFREMSKNKSVNYEHWKDIGFANKSEGKFMRKGEVGDWKNYFNPELLRTFEAWENLNDPNQLCKFKYEN